MLKLRDETMLKYSESEGSIILDRHNSRLGVGLRTLVRNVERKEGGLRLRIGLVKSYSNNSTSSASRINTSSCSGANISRYGKKEEG